MRNLTPISTPTRAQVLELVTVAEIKSNLRISHSVEDARIQEAILAAYAFFDTTGWLNRAIISQTWELRLPGFLIPQERQDDEARPVIRWEATREIPLPFGNLQSVDQVTYFDTDNVRQTLYEPAASTPVTSTVMAVTIGKLIGSVRLLAQQSWPQTYEDDESVRIMFTCGWGTPAWIRDNPRMAALRSAIALMAGHVFQNPSETFVEPRTIQVNRRIEEGYRALAGHYRIPKALVVT